MQIMMNDTLPVSATGIRPVGATMREDDRERNLIRLILESFRTDEIEASCRREGISQEELLGLREAFICAGAARVHDLLRPSVWYQVGVGLDPFGFQLTTFMTGPCHDRIRSWLHEGKIDRFFFLNKPPGLRLRFRASLGDLLPELSSWLDEQRKEGEITSWSRGVYEAEVHQFGGELGLDIAHAFFTAESIAVMGYRRLQLDDAETFSSPDFSLFLLNDFFQRVVEDRWELWDLWCNMALTERVPTFQGADLDRAVALADAARGHILELLDDRGPFLERISDAGRALLVEYQNQTRPIAERLRAARDEGALLYGLRQILPFWVIFHWNRMGFAIEHQQRLVFMILRALDPKRTVTLP